MEFLPNLFIYLIVILSLTCSLIVDISLFIFPIRELCSNVSLLLSHCCPENIKNSKKHVELVKAHRCVLGNNCSQR